MSSSVSSRHILLTGATDGIGFEAAKHLAVNRLCATLVLHGRNPEKLAKVAEKVKQEAAAKKDGNNSTGAEIPKIHLVIADFSSLESVRKMADEVIEKYPFINILCNNAGILTKEFSKTKEGFESTFGVNAVAPSLLTLLLFKPVLAKNQPSRIIFASSMAHLMYGLSSAQIVDGKQVRTGEKLTTIDLENVSPKTKEEFSWYRQYCLSKLANTAFTQELERRLRANNDAEYKDVWTGSFHPGVLETTLKNNGIEIPGLPPVEGIKTMIHLMTDNDSVKRNSGQYWDDHKNVATMNPIAKNEKETKAFYDAMLKWCGWEGASPL